MSMEDVQLEQLKMLRSIDATLKELLAVSKARRTAPHAQASAALPSPIATDAELDHEKADEKIKCSPRDWSGADFKGRTMSECPADFLELYAEMMAYFAGKNDERCEKTDRGTPKSVFDRKSERLARGWALRIRSGKHKPAPEAEPEW